MCKAWNVVKFEATKYNPEFFGIENASPMDWKRYPEMRVWQMSKHSFRWQYRPHRKLNERRQCGRATTFDAAVQAVLRARRGR